MIHDLFQVIFIPFNNLNDAVKALAIRKTSDDSAVKPSVDTALNGTYPVSRPLLYYTDGAPTGVIKAYIDYCLSAEGQQVVLDNGFVPLAK